MSPNKPPYLDELAKLIDSDQLTRVDQQLIESTVESLLHYFRSRAIEAQEMNQVIDINSKSDGKAKLAERHGTDASAEIKMIWPPEDIRAFEKQISDFSEKAKAVMRLFMFFPIGADLQTKTLHDLVWERVEANLEGKLSKIKRGELPQRGRNFKSLTSRDTMVKEINLCGMRKLYGSEGPFILRRGQRYSDRRAGKGNPLLFKVEKV